MKDLPVSLPVKGSVTISLTGMVDPEATGELVNTATVVGGAGFVDPNAADNTATDIDRLVKKADLEITKTDSTETATPGKELTYVITVTNKGPSASGKVRVTDVLPATLLDARWTCVASSGVRAPGALPNMGWSGSGMARMGAGCVVALTRTRPRAWSG